MDQPSSVVLPHAPAPAERLPAPRATASKPRVRWVGLLVFALLSTYATMAWTATLDKGPSFDEGLHLAVGYNLWLNGDYRMEGANGDLVKRWATLPYLLTKPRFLSDEDKYWKESAPYEVAHRFLFQLGNRPESLLWQGRAMVALLGVGTGLLVFFWARSLFGPIGGLIALSAFAFSPNMLAFGGIASTDMSITLTLFAATWCIWRLLHEITLRRILASLTALALLVLAKPTALIILPVTAILVGARLCRRVPVIVRWRDRAWGLHRRRTMLGAFSVLVLLHGVTAWGTIWAHYGFRYEASPEPEDPSLKFFRLEYRDETPGILRKSLAWIREARVLPEGFHRGVNLLVGSDDETVSFMNGSWRIGGRPEFFPYAIWAKTPPGLMLLVVAGLAAIALAPRLDRGVPSTDAQPRSLCYETIPLLTLIVCYLLIALNEDLNIGHRHVLPIYPAFYVLAGGAVIAFSGRWRRRATVVVAGVLFWAAADSFVIRPNYIAYFGPQVGGSDQGYKRLVDSSLDWGMSLPALQQWLDQHNPGNKTPTFLAYFGTDSARYQGFRGRLLPGFYDRRPIQGYPYLPGYYAISATLLQSLYVTAHGEWRQGYEDIYHLMEKRMQEIEQLVHRVDLSKLSLNSPEAALLREIIMIYDAMRFSRLCVWLRHNRPPDTQIDHSILIWKLSMDDLQAALRGPPAELSHDPIPKRQYGRYRPVRD